MTVNATRRGVALKPSKARINAIASGTAIRKRDQPADDLRFERELREDDAHYYHYLLTGQWLSPRPFPSHRK